jgi:hypothetical protein
MENQILIEKIKSSFCKLTNFKIRTNALEVITAYSTLNSRFVSVFITFTKDKIVITDSGWIDQNYYETPLYNDSEEIVRKTIETFKNSYNIKSTLDNEGVQFYYKICKTIEEVPNAVFDMANFIVGVVNSFCVQYKDEKEEKARATFRKDANSYLKSIYTDEIRLQSALDDFKSVKFNAIIAKKSDLYLLTYVTGSTQIYFENDLRKSIVNFEIADKSKYKDIIKEKITIINDMSEGYVPDKSTYIFELLNEKSTREPIKWTEKKKLSEII